MLPTAREPPTRRRLLRRGLDLLGSFQGDVSSFLDQLDPGGATWPLPHGAGDLTATSESDSAHVEAVTLISSDGISISSVVKPHGGDSALLSRVTTSFITLHDDLDATLRGLADLVSESRHRQRRSAGQSTATPTPPSLAQAFSRQATTSPAADSARPSSLSAVWDVPPFPLAPLPHISSSMAGAYVPGSRSSMPRSRSAMAGDYDYVLLEAAHEELRALGVDVVREAAATSAAAARLRAQSAQASAASGALRQQAWKRVRCSGGCGGECSMPRPLQCRGRCVSRPGRECVVVVVGEECSRSGLCSVGGTAAAGLGSCLLTSGYIGSGSATARGDRTRGTPPSLHGVHPPKHTSPLHRKWRERRQLSQLQRLRCSLSACS